VVASLYGGQYDRLTREMQQKMYFQLALRKDNYASGLAGQRWDAKFILVGDRPGPGASKMPANWHHTPFYSTRNSSFWMNKQLIEAGIPENNLFWLNSADMHGVPTNPGHLLGWGAGCRLVALGGAAAKWIGSQLKTAGLPVQYEKEWHPAAWKRFHSKTPYPLIPLLQAPRST